MLTFKTVSPHSPYKIDNHRSEYFLFHYMVGALANYIAHGKTKDCFKIKQMGNSESYYSQTSFDCGFLKTFQITFIGYTATDFADILQKLPNRILAPYQKRREYISSILSKHENLVIILIANLYFIELRKGTIFQILT